MFKSSFSIALFFLLMLVIPSLYAQHIGVVDELEIRTIIPACRNNDSIFLYYQQYMVNTLEVIEFEKDSREREFMRQLSCNEKVRDKFMDDSRALQRMYNDIYFSANDKIKQYREELEAYCLNAINLEIEVTAKKFNFDLIFRSNAKIYGANPEDITQRIKESLMDYNKEQKGNHAYFEFLCKLQQKYEITLPSDLRLKRADLCK